jgi:CheY-like chemotaxis protein
MAKILIVDDDKETTNLLERLVTMKGHLPTSVNNSVNAVETAHSLQPDIILMDILMPEINGIQLCKIFKAIPELKKIPGRKPNPASASKEQAGNNDPGEVAHNRAAASG